MDGAAGQRSGAVSRAQDTSEGPAVENGGGSNVLYVVAGPDAVRDGLPAHFAELLDRLSQSVILLLGPLAWLTALLLFLLLLRYCRGGSRGRSLDLLNLRRRLLLLHHLLLLH